MSSTSLSLLYSSKSLAVPLGFILVAMLSSKPHAFSAIKNVPHVYCILKNKERTSFVFAFCVCVCVKCNAKSSSSPQPH